jgi:hypothetical protein
VLIEGAAGGEAGARVPPADVDSSTAAPPSMLNRFFVWQVVNLLEWPLDPLDFLTHLASTMPLLVSGLLGLLLLRALTRGTSWTASQRFAHLLWIGWVLFFGMIDSGITTNYLLVPVTLMLAALAIDVAALARGPRFAALAVLAFSMWTWEQWGGPGEAAARLAAARPTVTEPAEISLREVAARAELVACTDELACLLLAGRVDRWLALDDFLRTRFIVSRGGREEGVYAGRPVARSLSQLFASSEGHAPPRRVLVIDVFKQLPVGPSARFLDDALAETRMRVRPVLATAQLRVIEIAADVP